MILVIVVLVQVLGKYMVGFVLGPVRGRAQGFGLRGSQLGSQHGIV